MFISNWFHWTTLTRMSNPKPYRPASIDQRLRIQTSKWLWEKCSARLWVGRRESIRSKANPMAWRSWPTIRLSVCVCRRRARPLTWATPFRKWSVTTSLLTNRSLLSPVNIPVLPTTNNCLHWMVSPIPSCKLIFLAFFLLFDWPPFLNRASYQNSSLDMYSTYCIGLYSLLYVSSTV